MLSTNDRKVAALLLNEGHLTREQIDECVGIKQRLEQPRSLASILVARRYVTYDRLKTIMADAIQRVQSREYSVAMLNGQSSAPNPAAPSAPLPSSIASQTQQQSAPQANQGASSNWNTDKELASLLVARHIVTEAQARECLGLLMQVLRSKPTARLTQVILKRRYASRDALRHVLKEYEAMQARRRNGSGPNQSPAQSQSAPVAHAPLPVSPPSGPQAAPSNQSNTFATPPQSGPFQAPSQQSGGFQVPPISAPSASPFASNPGSLSSSSPSHFQSAPLPSSSGELPGFGAPPKAEDPFASVKPNRPPVGGGFDSQAPLRFGSGANYSAVNPDASSEDHSRTVNLAVPNVSDFNSNSSPAPNPAFGNSVDLGHVVNGMSNSNESTPIGLDFADSEQTIGVRPNFNNSNAQPRLQQGSGAQFGAFNSGPVTNPGFSGGSAEFAPPPGIGAPPPPANNPFASNFGSSAPQPNTAPNGFKTMDLDDGEVTLSPASSPSNVAPGAFASGPTPSPFASGPTPSPFASGPTPGPAPGAFASGPTPSPFASGPTPAPFASGPTPAPAAFASGPTPAPAAFASGPSPSPFASGPSGPDPFASGPASGPMGSAAAPAGFRTFDLNDSQGPAKSTGGARRSTRVEQSSATNRKKKKKKKANSRSRASVDRRSRAEIAAELQGRSFQTTEILIIIGCIIACLGLAYAGWAYVKNEQHYKQLRDQYQNAYNQGNNSQAFELVKQLLEYDPDDPSLQEAFDDLREKVKAEERRQKAVELLNQAKAAKTSEEAVKLCREATKTDETFATAYVELGRSLYRLAQAKRRAKDMDKFRSFLSEADENFREALVHKSDNQVAHFYLAEVIRERAKTIDRSTLTDLRGSYSRGMNANKQSFYGRFCEARLRLLDGKRDDALKYITQAIEEDKTQTLALLTRAEIYMHRREYAEALKDLKRILEISPGDPDALFLKAHVHYWQEEYERGLSMVEKGMKADQGSAYGMGLQAYGMWKLDPSKKQDAINLCKRAIKFDDRHYYPYRVYGEIVLGKEGEEQNLNLAGKQFWLAIARAKYVAQNYYLYGKTLQFSLDNSGAEKHYASCLRYDKKHVEALANQGTVLKALKKYDESLDHFNRAIKLRRHDARIIFQRAKVKWEKLSQKARANQRSIQWTNSQWKEVMLDLDESIRLNAKIADVWGRRGYLKERQIWSKVQKEVPAADRGKEFRKRCRPALNDYDQAIKLDKGVSTYWNGVRCLLFTKIGRYADAIEDGDKFLTDKRRKMNEENIRRRVDAAIKECKKKLEQNES